VRNSDLISAEKGRGEEGRMQYPLSVSSVIDTPDASRSAETAPLAPKLKRRSLAGFDRERERERERERRK